MAQQRGRAGTLSGPHSISLKVLRLSRPSLATQITLPQTSFGNGLDVSPRAALAYPSADATSSFPLTPLLTLPAAFGAAYVGETFTCTLCANNELLEDSDKSVSDVQISAELQSPSNKSGHALGLEMAEGEEDLESVAGTIPGATVQRTLRHELTDEGPHVLVVTVTYVEAIRNVAGSERTRTFRKLYQFVAQQLIAVRSKITERKRPSPDTPREWILEAQLENMGETSVVIERISLKEREGIKSMSVNGSDDREAVVLKPQDIEQIMFIASEGSKSDDATRRLPLAQLSVEWRNAMSERGSLKTGWLASRGH